MGARIGVSMLAYPYCVLPRGHAPPEGLRGVDGAAVRVVSARDLSIWASPVRRPPSASIERVRAHHAVVDVAASDGVTPLPLRFGQCSPPRALRRRLAEDSQDWRSRLADLAGTVEFGLLLAGTAAPPGREEASPAGSGREYLTRLVERRKRTRELDPVAQEAVDALQRHVGSLPLREAVSQLPGRSGAARVAHLVARNRAGEYRSSVEEYLTDHPEHPFILAGPLPPWTFGT